MNVINLYTEMQDLQKVIDQDPNTLAESEPESDDGYKIKKELYVKGATRLDSSGK